MSARRREIGIVPLELIRDAEAELADEGGPVAAAVVVAGEVEVGGGRAGVVDAVVGGPFEVAVVVVGGEVVVGEVLVGVAGAPFRVLRFSHVSVHTQRSCKEGWSDHHLNVQAVIGADVEGSFSSSNARPCGGIVRSPHGIRLAVAALYGLVDYFQHADIPVVVVRMDDVRHPLEEFVSAFVLVIHVETRRGGVLSRAIQ